MSKFYVLLFVVTSLLYMKMIVKEDFPEMHLFVHYCYSTLFVPTPSVVNPDTHTHI